MGVGSDRGPPRRRSGTGPHRHAPFLGVRGTCRTPGRSPPPGIQREGSRHGTYSPVEPGCGLASVPACCLPKRPEHQAGGALKQDACLARRVSAAVGHAIGGAF